MNCEKRLQIAIPMVLCLLVVAMPASAALGVTGIDPSWGLNTGTRYIANLSGTDFPDQEFVSVALNRTGHTDIPGQYVTVASPTRITCVFDLFGQDAGFWNVIVTNSNDSTVAQFADGFEVRNPVPTVVSISPDNGENTAPVPITNLAGSNFLPGANVTLTRSGQPNITASPVNVVTSGQITCTLDITGAETGNWDVVVTNTDGQSAILPGGFRVRFPEPAVSSIDPAEGTNDRVIGITDLAGTGFRPGANVTLTKSGQPNITTINGPIVESPTKILCFFDLNGKAVGAWNVVVTNTDGQSGPLPNGFIVYYPEAPTVTGISPPTGANTGLVPATITGTGFQEGATVVLNQGAEDIPGSGVFVSSPTSVSCVFNLSGRPAGTWNVIVMNDDGQSGILTGGFTVTNPGPTVTSVAPPSGLNTGPFTISNITGTGFLNGAQVKLVKTGESDIVAGSVTVESGTRINCTVDLAGRAAGDWDVVVTNTDSQSGTLAAGFTIENPDPMISSIDPSQGENTGPVVILALRGANFLEGAGINLTMTSETPIPGTGVVRVNATALTCTFDLTGKASGGWNVVVTNPDGKSDQLDGAFSITDAPPTVTGIIPSGGPNDDNVPIMNLSGTGFLDGASVKLSRAGELDIHATGVVVESPNKIMCFFDLNGKKVGPWDVVVTNTDTQSGTLPGGFTIFYPQAPAITGITPSYGTNTGSVPITNLSGSGFQPGASVVLTLDGETNITATEVMFVNSNMLTCTFDLTGKKPAWWNIVVTNNDGKSGMLEFGFHVRDPAPTVTGITPPKGNNNVADFTVLDLAGTGFHEEGITTVNLTLGGETITATNVDVVNSGTITCHFNLNGRTTGVWDIVVTNPDGQTNPPSAGAKFTIEYPAPVVDTIIPNKGANDGTVLISAITGNYFRDGASVKFTKNGQYDIHATDVHVINANTLNCTVDLTGKATGNWNVVVTNIDGKIGVRTGIFKVLPPAPVVNFTASPTLGTVPLTVHFTDLTTNNPQAWVWDFGDGSLSGVLDQNPTHTYNEPGTYTVDLRVPYDGKYLNETKPYYIVVVTHPVAEFTASPTSGNTPLLVQFTDQSDGNPTSWVWRFGDGSMSTQKNPYHLYTQVGNFTVSLSVSNRGGSDSVTKEDLIKVRAVPTADFAANRTSGASPLAVRFSDLSTGAPTSWSWSFGDGETSTEQEPVHVYSVPGTYNVRLTIANSVGTDTRTKFGYITVEEGFSAAYTYTTSNPENLAPLTVAFTDQTEGMPIRWVWDFDDGFISTQRNPIHTFENPGTYQVTLSVSDSKSTAYVTQPIVVKQRLIADFSATPSTGTVPLTVQLSDTSIGEPQTWNWMIKKDGFNYTFMEPGSENEVYTFNEPGFYDVQLNVTDAYGNEDGEYKPNVIQVFPFP